MSYTLSYSNSGSLAAAGVQLSQTIPTGFTISSATPAASSVSGQTLRWDLGSLAAAANGSISIQVVPGVDAASSAVSSATISSSSAGETSSGNSASHTTSIIAPNLVVSMSGSATLAAGATGIYSLGYRNSGSASATAAQLSLILPSGLSLVSATPAASSVSGQTLRWELGTLAAAANGTISLALRAATSFSPSTSTSWAQSLSASLSSSSLERPADTSNNSATLTTTLLRPELSVVMSVDPTTLVGDDTIYLLTYSNSGSIAAAGVEILSTLPVGFTFIEATLHATAIAQQTINWNIASVAAGATGSITLRARPTATAEVAAIGQVTISSSTIGDSSVGNSSSATTTVLFPNPQISLSLDDPLPIGEWRTATLHAANLGSGQARSTVVTATLEAELLLGALPVGCERIADGAVVNGTLPGPRIRCMLGDLAAGATESRTLTLRAPGRPGEQTNFSANAVRIASEIGMVTPERPSDASNNQTLVTVRAIRPNSYVGVTAVRKSLATAGDAGWQSYVAFQVRYGNSVASNTLPIDLRRPDELTRVAEGVVLTVTLPVASVLHAVSGAPLAYQVESSTAGATLLTLNLGMLAAQTGGVFTVTVRVEEQPGASVVVAAQITTATPGDEPLDNLAQDDTAVIAPPIDIEGEGDLLLTIHSTLDPRSGGSGASDAVYHSTGGAIAWPAGEVLDFSPRLSQLVIRDAYGTDDPLIPYGYRARIVGWGLISFTQDGQTVQAQGVGCRTGSVALPDTSMVGCTYTYPGASDQGVDPHLALPDDTLITESLMASQGHVYWTHQGIGGLTVPSMRGDVYHFTLGQILPVAITVEVEVEVWVVNLYPGAPIGDWTTPEPAPELPGTRERLRFTDTFHVDLLVPRSVVR
jgi:uncharacterized repeat protein (TIGR01451 family)